LTVLHQFPQGNLSNMSAWRIIQGADGAFYGIASDNYYFNQNATLFRMSADGVEFTNIYSFGSTSLLSDVLVQGPNGYLYGGTRGSYFFNSLSSVFAVSPNGTDYSVLRYFPGGAPTALHFDANDVLYGAASAVAFKMKPDGGAYRELHTFSGDEGSVADFCLGSAGEMYGITGGGGQMGLGTVFALNATTNSAARAVQITDTIVYGPEESVIHVNIAAQGNEHSLSFTLSFYAGFLRYKGFDALLGSGAPQVNVNTADAAAGILHITVTQPEGHTFRAGVETLLALKFSSPGVEGKTFIDFGAGGTVQDLNGQPLDTTWIDGSVSLVNCTATLSSVAIQLPAAGISQATVSLDIGPSCSWDATTTNDWIRTPSFGVGPGSVLYAVDPNFSASPRTGAIFVAGQAIVFNQEGLSALGSLNLTIIGRGTVTPDYAGQQLVTGQGYEMQAEARPGFTFTAWSGDVYDTNATLHFTMRPGLNITATFVPSSFIIGQGSFAGLFQVADMPDLKSSGLVSFRVTRSGAFSGKVLMGTNHYSLHGHFDPAGNAQVLATAPGKSPLQVRIQKGEYGGLIGTVGNSEWTATLSAYGNWYNGRTIISPFAGRYTMVLGTDAQPGHSYAIISASKSGIVRFSGSLADGTKLSYSAPSVSGSTCPFSGSLYRGKGAVFGWLYLTYYYMGAGGGYEFAPVGGQLWWIRPGLTNNTTHDSSFTVLTDVFGSYYDAPLIGDRILSISNGVVALEGGPASTGFKGDFLLATNNRVTATNPAALNLTFSKSTGLFHGQAKETVSNKKYSFGGVVLQGIKMGKGYFRSDGRTGDVTIQGASQQ
jgi:hypothetical protein